MPDCDALLRRGSAPKTSPGTAAEALRTACGASRIGHSVRRPAPVLLFFTLFLAFGYGPTRAAEQANTGGCLNETEAPTLFQQGHWSPPVRIDILRLATIWPADKETEGWVLKQLTSPNPPNVVDLSALARRKRVLSGSFIARLLTSPPSRLPRGVQILHGIVSDPVDVSGATIEPEVALRDFFFLRQLDLRRTRFKRGLDLQESVFLTDLLADDAVFVDHLLVRGASFLKGYNSPLKGGHNRLSFARLVVGGSTDFQGACFEGGADFSDSSLAGSFFLRRIKVLDSEQGFDLNGMRIAGTVTFRYATIRANLDASEMAIGGDLLARYAMFFAPADFSRTRVIGLTNFNNATFDCGARFRKCSLAFREARFRSGLTLQNTKFHGAAPGDLTGMTYETINAGPDDPQWLIHDLLKPARWAPSLYADLEGFYRQRGLQERADEVYFAFWRRALGPDDSPCATQARRWCGLKQTFRSAWSRIGDYYIGFGRRPVIALLYYSGFVLFGGALFWLPSWNPGLRHDRRSRFVRAAAIAMLLAVIAVIVFLWPFVGWSRLAAWAVVELSICVVFILFAGIRVYWLPWYTGPPRPLLYSLDLAVLPRVGHAASAWVPHRDRVWGWLRWYTWVHVSIGIGLIFVALWWLTGGDIIPILRSLTSSFPGL